jgi:hypothetical protein
MKLDEFVNERRRLVLIEEGKDPDTPWENYRHSEECRMLMENKLNRKLTSKEVVHHKDGNPSNNDVDNLEVLTRREHWDKHLMVVRFGKRTAVMPRIIPMTTTKHEEVSEQCD